MYFQKKLKCDKVTGSLVVPLICDLRTNLTNLTDVVDDLRKPALDDDEADLLQTQAILLSCMQGLLKGFNCCWANGLE